MSPSSAPYFYEQALSGRFILDVSDALALARIDETQARRLLRMFDGTALSLPGSDPLRVDRLLMDDGLPGSAELSCAWLISDPASDNGPIYLHTLLFGIERFDGREQLFDHLKQGFAGVLGLPRTLDRERVEGALTERRMLAILEQQVGHLQTLTEQLRQLPTAHQALGQTLQKQFESRPGHLDIDVFSHLLLIVHSVVATDTLPIVASMTLADAALHDYVNESLPMGLQRQFLDERGAALTPLQALPCVESLSAVRSALPAVYERLLDEFWLRVTADGRTVRELAGQALEDAFRHALLTAREEDRVSPPEFCQLRTLLAPTTEEHEAPVIVSRVSVSLADRGMVKLAGMFLIELPSASAPGFYLYSSKNGLDRFADKQTLSEHFMTPAGRAQLYAHASLEDRPLLAAGSATLRFDPIEQPLFTGHMDSVIAVQKRNLRYVLGQAPVTREQVAAWVDDALDIRSLIDCRLPYLADSRRWRADGASFQSTWPGVPTAPAATSTPMSVLTVADGNSWVKRVQTLDRRIDALGILQPDIVECAAAALDRYLIVLGGPALKARTLWVESGGKARGGLIEHFLRRVSGYSSERLADNSRIDSGPDDLGRNTPVSHLSGSLLNHVFDLTLPLFSQAYEAQLRQFHEWPLRLLGQQIRPRRLASRFREEILQLEVSIEHRLKKMRPPEADMIRQVVGRPVASLRRMAGDAATSVNGVLLSYVTGQAAVPMTNVFVLHQPARPSSHVLWSPFNGFQAFPSLSALEAFLSAGLASPERGPAWLGLLYEQDRASLRPHLQPSAASVIKVHLTAIEGHFIEILQDAEIERQCQAILATYRQALRWKIDADLLGNLLSVIATVDKNRDALDCLAMGMDVVMFNTLQPDWLKNASRRDRAEFFLLARDLYLTFDANKNFLFGIPALRDYACEQLATRLKLDFPDLVVDPDAITLTLTIYTPAPVATGNTPSGLSVATNTVDELLPDYAINRLAAVQQGLLSVSLDNGAAGAAAAITPTYLNGMIRTLDVGGSYQRQLDARLDDQAIDFAKREAFYLEQSPPLERLAALQARIRGELSAPAYEFIEAVLYMPDGLARLPIGGRSIILSPLQLLAEEDATPDPVTGMYIIAPRVPQAGPWILYVLLDNDFLFKEYDDQASLLADIRTSPALQSLILQRVSAQARMLYQHGGFIEPHVPFSTESFSDMPLRAPGPVTLKITPWEGNALHCLFRGTLDTIKLLTRLSSITTEQSDRQSLRYGLSLLIEQGMVFLPGRLGVMVRLWQSESLLQASFGAASQKEWGEALSTFSAALSCLVGSGPTPEEGVSENLGVEEVAAADSAPQRLEFGWSNGTLTRQQASQLRQLSVTNVVLNKLSKDELLNIYRDPAGERQYAAVAGVVYRIRQTREGWRIVGDTADGPAIRLNREQQWELDLPSGLRGGGGIVTRLRSAVVEAHLESVAIVEASGMSAIRLKYRNRARQIAEAHFLAGRYLDTSLDNINVQSPGGSIHPRAERIISDFFGVSQPGERLYGAIRTSISEIFSALVDPSLSPFRSERFVVVSNRMGQPSVDAFMFAKDPLKRVFLSETFFRAPAYLLSAEALRQQPFNHGTHFRATTLLHELSHVASKTQDIAYLDASAPFVDLLDDSTAYRVQLKEKLRVSQQNSLSHLTPATELFKRLSEGNSWQDLKGSDGEGKSTILRIAGTTTLDQARAVFYANADIRSEILLNNADSVALLITLLGRENFVG